MWSNVGDKILSPFSGVASEGCQAVKMNRKYYGIELKRSYYETSKNNISAYVESKKQLSLI